MILPCPACPATVEVSEEDPDGSLSDMWDHLGRHTRDKDEREILFIQSQGRAR